MAKAGSSGLRLRYFGSSARLPEPFLVFAQADFVRFDEPELYSIRTIIYCAMGCIVTFDLPYQTLPFSSLCIMKFDSTLVENDDDETRRSVAGPTLDPHDFAGTSLQATSSEVGTGNPMRPNEIYSGSDDDDDGGSVTVIADDEALRQSLSMSGGGHSRNSSYATLKSPAKPSSFVGHRGADINSPAFSDDSRNFWSADDGSDSSVDGDELVGPISFSSEIVIIPLVLSLFMQ